MLKKNLFILAVIALFALALPVAAQTQAPTAISAALSDLSNRVGRTLAVTDLQNWTWEQNVFPDTSLGCPRAGTMYAQVQTSGFKFLLTYNGVQYDYRVSNDQQIVILCNSDAAPVTSGGAVCPPPGDTGYITSRLQVGIQGRVSADGAAIPNNVRSIPGTSGTYLGEIPPGGVFTVLEGPQCSQVDKLIWWRVDYNGMVGWTVEGQIDNGETDYWLEPVDAALIPTPSATTTISSSNAGQVQMLSSFPVLMGITAVSPDGKWMANGGVDGRITLVDTATGAETTAVLAQPVSITALAFSPDSKLMASGGAGGETQLWDVDATGARVRLPLQGHTASVDALTFSPSGGLLASGSADGRVILWDVNLGFAVAQLTGHSGTVTRLMFSADGSQLLTVDSAGTVRTWGIRLAGNG